jgi:hypothetical protein
MVDVLGAAPIARHGPVRVMVGSDQFQQRAIVGLDRFEPLRPFPEAHAAQAAPAPRRVPFPGKTRDADDPLGPAVAGAEVQVTVIADAGERQHS